MYIILQNLKLPQQKQIVFVVGHVVFCQTELISQTSLWHINSGKQPLKGKRHIFPRESYKVEARTL